MKKENIDLRYISKVIFAILLIVILYLFALNGRYEKLGNLLIMDKWKKEVISSGSNELPFKNN